MRARRKMGFEHRQEHTPDPWQRRTFHADRDSSRLALPTHRYRFMIFAKPAGEWTTSLAEAQRDAIRAGLASREEWSGRLYLTVPGWIQRERLAQL